MSPTKSLETILGTLIVCLLLSSSVYSGQAREASASIRASATVVNPTGMVLFDSSAIQAASSELGFETDDLSLNPVSSVLVHFPPGSSVLLLLEAEGKAVDHFVLSEKADTRDQSNKDGRSISGGYLLKQQALTESLPEGSNNCIVTIIHTGS